MHQIRFRPGLRGAYSAPPDALADLRDPTSKGKGGRWGKRKERDRAEREREDVNEK